MINNLANIKPGLVLVMLGLLFGIGLGIYFGANEAFFQSYIAQGIAAHPEFHDAKSAEKIWRCALRAHFHSAGIAAFSIGLLLLVLASSLTQRLKKITSLFIGMGCLYPLAWFSIFILAPNIGRDAARAHPVTEFFTYAGTGGLLLGIAILLANIFFGLFSEKNKSYK